MRDLLVVGGGPVGLATALHAADAGLDVAVLEPRGGPVDKACGEGLMPGAVHRLAALGVDPPGVDLRGIGYLDGPRRAEARFRGAPGRGVRRTTLHDALAGRVAQVGVPVEAHRVRTVDVREDRVVVDGLEARYLVAADGLHSPVRRMLGLRARERASSRRHGGGRRRFGQRLHVATAPWSDLVEVHWGERSEAYVTPVAPDLVGVAVLTDVQAPLERLLADFPALLERLGGSERTTVRGAGPLRQATRRRTAGRVLLAGDAAGYVDALTGEGIALGLADAEASVAAVAAGDPAGYEGEWRRRHRRHDLLTRSLLGVSSRPRLRRALVPTAQHLPWAFSAAVEQMARPA